MLDVIGSLASWFEHHLAISLLVFAGWIVLGVVALWLGHRFLVTIPANYFAQGHRPLERWRDSHPALRWTLLISKNLLGLVLAVAGIVMIVTPGQGVLTLLLGISLLDVPGKQTVERKIIERPTVLRLVNRLRARAHQPPLDFEPVAGPIE